MFIRDCTVKKFEYAVLRTDTETKTKDSYLYKKSRSVEDICYGLISGLRRKCSVLSLFCCALAMSINIYVSWDSSVLASVLHNLLSVFRFSSERSLRANNTFCERQELFLMPRQHLSATQYNVGLTLLMNV
jgi:hypothetical protein